MAERLYPPIISGTLPAFYQNWETVDGKGAADIAVPFSMNRAVNTQAITGFSLKIKTVQNNIVVDTLEVTENISDMIEKKIAYFTLTELKNKVKLGQFFKVQLAYLQEENGSNIPGYYSTVGIIKYTSKPNIYIESLLNDENTVNKIWAFRSNYIGVYEPGEDKSERSYQYKFSLYDDNDQLIETTNWLLHNSSLDEVSNESLTLDRAIDQYTFKTGIEVNKFYKIQYSVRTINNLEISSPLYVCAEPGTVDAELKCKLNAENIFDEGYIKLFFTLEDKYSLEFSSLRLIKQKYQDLSGTPFYEEDKNNDKYIIYTDSFQTIGYQIFYHEDDSSQACYVFKGGQRNDTLSSFSKDQLEKIYLLGLNNPIFIEICRAEESDNFSSWKVLQKVCFTSYDQVLNYWDFKDFTIEQGITYQYCFRQYAENNISSNRSLSNIVIADFEDMFLWDGEKQLKIRFNPKVSSFKTTHLESKMDTIGSRYPFIFRNGVVEYKEFPIAGLISYYLDNNNMFMNTGQKLGISFDENIIRLDTPAFPSTLENAEYEQRNKELNSVESLDLTSKNMKAERIFKLELLDWLSNGEIKMFKSPAEGNYLVRLLNISLSPEDKVGRMLHNFSCTAYEVEECNYNSLVSLNFIKSADIFNETIKGWETVNFQRKISENNVSNNELIQINNYPIFEYAKFNFPSGSNFYIRVGTREYNTLFLISSDTNEFELFSLPKETFQDIFLCQSDNNNISSYNDIELTYQYHIEPVAMGSLENIKDIYLEEVSNRLIGPGTINIKSFENNKDYEILKFTNLTFEIKSSRPIQDFNNLSQEEQQLYLKEDNGRIFYHDYDNDTDIEFNANTMNIITINYYDENSAELIINDTQTPLIIPNSTKLKDLSSIEIGAGIILTYSCQQKVIEYNNQGE